MHLRTLVTGLSLLAFAACTASEQRPGSAGANGANQKLLDAYVAAWNNHDSASLDTLLAPDAVHEDLAQGFTGHGAAEVKGFMSELIKMEPDYKWQITKVFDSGDNVAAEWTWTATYSGPGPSGPVTNLHISGRGSSIMEVENGRIKRFADYYDNASYFPKPPADTTKKSG